MCLSNKNNPHLRFVTIIMITASICTVDDRSVSFNKIILCNLPAAPLYLRIITIVVVAVRHHSHYNIACNYCRHNTIIIVWRTHVDECVSIKFRLESKTVLIIFWFWRISVSRRRRCGLCFTYPPSAPNTRNCSL